MPKDKGIKVSVDILLQFFHVIIEHNTWFPEEGTLDVDCWERVSHNLKIPQQHGKNLPPICFCLWNMILHLLEPFRETRG